MAPGNGSVRTNLRSSCPFQALCLAFGLTHGNQVTRVAPETASCRHESVSSIVGILATNPSRFRLARCAIYTRQSVLRRGEDVTLSSCQLQRDRCVEFARSMALRGWEPIDEHFDDEGFSGATVKRPALERLIERIQDGDIQQVIVYRLDRLTRKLSDWARLVAVFDRFKVGLMVVSGVLAIESGSMARFQLQMLATMAELERDMIAERLADARAARKARGLRCAGRVPFGYVADRTTKRLIINEREANTVRQLFEQAAQGMTPSKLVATANKHGTLTKTGSRWSTRAMLRLLRNPVYRGCLSDGLPGVQTAIIDNELFDEVQKVIAQRRTRKPSKRTPYDERFDPFILRGLLRCDRCGHVMTPSMSKALTRSAPSTPRYYRCRTEGCRVGQVSADVVESSVPKLLTAIPTTDEQRVRLEQVTAAWDLLWPCNRRRALAQEFRLVQWCSGERRLMLEPTGMAILRDGARTLMELIGVADVSGEST
ncbi:MAG TPA: recombinase family protein [Polyangiaceae bacterium]|nr:recombinase family protein [Polyangiaceae bacterium]